MLKRIELFMRNERNSVMVYLLIILVLSIMISMNRGHLSNDFSHGKEVTYPIEKQATNQLVKNS